MRKWETLVLNLNSQLPTNRIANFFLLTLSDLIGHIFDHFGLFIYAWDMYFWHYFLMLSSSPPPSPPQKKTHPVPKCTCSWLVSIFLFNNVFAFHMFESIKIFLLPRSFPMCTEFMENSWKYLGRWFIWY